MKTYRPRIDAWLVALLAVGLAWITWGVLRLDGWWKIVGLLGVYGYVAGLVVLLAWPIEYSLSSDTLHVRTGRIRTDVPLASILAARRSTNLWLANTLSFRRLVVEFEGDGTKRALNIAPRDRGRLLEDLAAASPGHQLENGALVRVDGGG